MDGAVEKKCPVCTNAFSRDDFRPVVLQSFVESFVRGSVESTQAVGSSDVINMTLVAYCEATGEKTALVNSVAAQILSQTSPSSSAPASRAPPQIAVDCMDSLFAMIVRTSDSFKRHTLTAQLSALDAFQSCCLSSVRGDRIDGFDSADVEWLPSISEARVLLEEKLFSILSSLSSSSSTTSSSSSSPLSTTAMMANSEPSPLIACPRTLVEMLSTSKSSSSSSSWSLCYQESSGTSVYLDPLCTRIMMADALLSATDNDIDSTDPSASSSSPPSSSAAAAASSECSRQYVYLPAHIRISCAAHVLLGTTVVQSRCGRRAPAKRDLQEQTQLAAHLPVGTMALVVEVDVVQAQLLRTSAKQVLSSFQKALAGRAAARRQHRAQAERRARIEADEL